MTTQPSAQYRQHHDVEPPRVDTRSFRQGWRVCTRLDRLLADVRITPRTWQAAIAYRDAWAAASRSTGGGTGRLEPARIGGRGPDAAHSRLLSQLEALARIAESERAIGRLAADLCYACAVADLPWAGIGRTYRCNAETARDWTVAALSALAAAWDRRRAPATPLGTGDGRGEASAGLYGPHRRRTSRVGQATAGVAEPSQEYGLAPFRDQR
jgi:predicted DCC family thiol-disulfide oxidoreductase YuxK